MLTQQTQSAINRMTTSQQYATNNGHSVHSSRQDNVVQNGNKEQVVQSLAQQLQIHQNGVNQSGFGAPPKSPMKTIYTKDVVEVPAPSSKKSLALTTNGNSSGSKLNPNNESQSSRDKQPSKNADPFPQSSSSKTMTNKNSSPPIKSPMFKVPASIKKKQVVKPSSSVDTSKIDMNQIKVDSEVKKQVSMVTNEMQELYHKQRDQDQKQLQSFLAQVVNAQQATMDQNATLMRSIEELKQQQAQAKLAETQKAEESEKAKTLAANAEKQKQNDKASQLKPSKDNLDQSKQGGKRETRSASKDDGDVVMDDDTEIDEDDLDAPKGTEEEQWEHEVPEGAEIESDDSINYKNGKYNFKLGPAPIYTKCPLKQGGVVFYGNRKWKILHLGEAAEAKLSCDKRRMFHVNFFKVRPRHYTTIQNVANGELAVVVTKNQTKRVQRIPTKYFQYIEPTGSSAAAKDRKNYLLTHDNVFKDTKGNVTRLLSPPDYFEQLLLEQDDVVDMTISKNKSTVNTISTVQTKAPLVQEIGESSVEPAKKRGRPKLNKPHFFPVVEEQKQVKNSAAVTSSSMNSTSVPVPSVTTRRNLVGKNTLNWNSVHQMTQVNFDAHLVSFLTRMNKEQVTDLKKIFAESAKILTEYKGLATETDENVFVLLRGMLSDNEFYNVIVWMILTSEKARSHLEQYANYQKN